MRASPREARFAALVAISVAIARPALAASSCCASLGSAPSALDNCGGSRPVGAPFATRSPVLSRRGQVASAHPLASDAGLDMLKRGGSAVDAAIATNLVLGVLEPMMNGMGGDLMAQVWDEKGQQLVGYNGAGRSSASFSFADMQAAIAELGAGTMIPGLGPLAVTVPGAPRGWCDLHQRFGKLPWADVFAPAIFYATNGAPVPQIIAEAEWGAIPNNTAMTSAGRFPHAVDGWAQTYGAAPRQGDVFKNPALASALTLLAADASCAAYYEAGPLRDGILALRDSTGLRLTAADLAAHQGAWVTPVSARFRGVDVFQLPPNPQGAAALEMLNILEAFNFTQADFNSADYLHAHVEAKKLAFADASAFFADPAFATVPVDGIISKAYAATQRARINMTRAAMTDAPGAPPPGGRLEDIYGGDTTYLTAADGDGMMVSLIQSLYTGFGSGIVAPSLGFALQSRGSLFSMEPASPNVYAPAKRPYHTIMPGFAASADKSMRLSFGVMGGFMQARFPHPRPSPSRTHDS
jgi:gamma-glutamyltranspeptidase/glutathione hydrolase